MGQAWYANSVGKSKDLFCAFCDQWEEGTGTLETEKGEAVEGSENQARIFITCRPTRIHAWCASTGKMGE